MGGASVGAGCGLLLSLAAVGCSSSHAGSADSGLPFPKDSATDVVKDVHIAETGPKMPGDAGCGAKWGEDWCSINAPVLGASSNVTCDDFDTGALNPDLGWVGIFRRNFVDTHWVSPYCALHAYVADGGAPNTYTEHPKLGAPASGTATFAFDLFIPGGSTCANTAIARVLAWPGGDDDSHAAVLWVSVSNVAGSGSSATSYELSLTAGVGADAGQSTPVIINVSPRSQDNGWARGQVAASRGDEVPRRQDATSRSGVWRAVREREFGRTARPWSRRPVWSV
jgi:hypothetical protein